MHKLTQTLLVKIIIYSACLLIISFGGFGFSVYWGHHKALVKEEIENLGTHSKIGAEFLNVSVSNLIRDVIFWSQQPQTLDAFLYSNFSQVAENFESFIASHKEYYQIRLISKEGPGQELIRVTKQKNNFPLVELKNLPQKGDRDFFKEAIRKKPGEVYLSKIELSRENGKVIQPHVPVIRASIPVYNKNFEVLGIVVINQDFNSVIHHLSHIFQDGDTYITNSSGDYIFHPDSSKTFGFEFGSEQKIQNDNPELKPFFGNTNNSYTYAFKTDQNDKNKLIHIRKVFFDPYNKERFLTLSVVAPYDEVFASSEVIKKRSIIIFISLVLLSLFIAFYFSKKISQPIEKITKAARQAALGNYDVDIRVKTNDEIGVLATTFSFMLDEIKKTTWLLKTQHELSTIIRGQLDLNVISKKTIDFICEKLDSKIGLLYLNSKDGSLVLKATHGLKNNIKQFSEYPLINKFLTEVVNTGNQQLLSGRDNNNFGIDSQNQENIYQHAIIFPLLLGNQVRAVIQIATEKQITHMMQELLLMVGPHIAISINSSEYKSKLQEAYDSLEEKNAYLEQEKMVIKQYNREIQLIRSQIEEKASELETANRYKSEFLANMSHELRTPLNSMLILTKLLFDNKHRNLNEDQLEDLQIILKSGKDLLELINDILDLSKVEAGKLTLTFENSIIDDTVLNLKKQFDPVARKNDLQFVIKVADNIPTTIYTDRLRLEQIIKNLLSNAFKFTSSGSVTFSIFKPDEDISFSQFHHKIKNVIAFSVKDTGPGIPEDKQKVIFEAFQQVDGSISRQFGGTGLGLSITTKLSKLLGGQVVLKSKVGEGSCFTFYLPIENNPANVENKVNQSQKTEAKIEPLNPNLKSYDTSLKDKKILLIDDDMRNAFSLCKTLESQDMNVLIAENSQSALDILKEEADVDCILIDTLTTEINSFEAISLIRKIEHYKSLPIIALTADDAKVDIEKKCVDNGANKIIKKSIDSEQLITIIRNYF